MGKIYLKKVKNNKELTCIDESGYNKCYLLKYNYNRGFMYVNKYCKKYCTHGVVFKLVKIEKNK